MSDSFRAASPDQKWSSASNGSNGFQGSTATPNAAPHDGTDQEGSEVGKALLVGVLGGLVSAAGYFVYRRLPDEQKDRLHSQVKTLVAQRISEIRQNFNI